MHQTATSHFVMLLCAIILFPAGPAAIAAPASGSVAIPPASWRLPPSLNLPDDAASFSPASYRVATEAGRFVISASLSVVADTNTLAELPVAGLGLIEARLDGVPAILIPGEGAVRCYIPAGRHQFLLRGSLPLARNRVGIFADWTPRCPGLLADSGSIRVEGALPTTGGWALTGGAIKLIAGRGAAMESVGNWLVDVRSDFIIGAETVNSVLVLEFKAFGLASETFAVMLPACLLPVEVKGNAEEVTMAAGMVVVRPTADQGTISITAEGSFPGGALDLSGLGLRGVPYGTRRLRVIAADGAEINVTASEGLTPEMNSVLRIVGERYKLLVATRKIESTSILAAEIASAELISVLRPDGKQESRLTLTLNGNPGQYLAFTLPAGARIESADANGIKVAPVQTRDGYLIPLKDQATTASIVYTQDGSDWWFWDHPLLTAPAFFLPVQNYSWQVWIPDKSKLLWSSGPWTHFAPWPTPLIIVDWLTDAGGFIFSILWWIVKWGILFAIVVLIVRYLSQHSGETASALKKIFGMEIVPSKSFVSCLFIMVLCMIIFVSFFVALGPQVKNMFSNAVSGQETNNNKAALSATIYGGYGAHEARPASPAASADAEENIARELATQGFGVTRQQPAAPVAPPAPATVTNRRRGSVSIAVAFTPEGTPHQFGRSDLESGGNLQLALLGKKTRYFLLLLWLALTAGLMRAVRIRAIPLFLLGAVLDSLLPGIFAATVFGILLMLIARRLNLPARLRRNT